MKKSKGEFVIQTDQKGHPRVYAARTLDSFFKQWPNSRFIVSLKKIDEERNPRQAVYFATYIPQLQHGLAERGYNFDKIQCHEFVRQYCPVMYEMVDLDEYSKPAFKSTSDLSNEEWEQYFEELGMFAVENLDLIIN